MTIDTLLSPLEVILLKKERQQAAEEGRQEGHQKGVEEGHRKGLIQAVKLGLELRFRSEGYALFARVERCSDLSILAEASEAIRRGTGLKEIAEFFPVE